MFCSPEAVLRQVVGADDDDLLDAAAELGRLLHVRQEHRQGHHEPGVGVVVAMVVVVALTVAGTTLAHLAPPQPTWRR